MAASILTFGRPAAPRRPRAARAGGLGVPRELTNGAPCLGLALAAGGLLWGLLGSVLALVLS